MKLTIVVPTLIPFIFYVTKHSKTHWIRIVRCVVSATVVWKSFQIGNEIIVNTIVHWCILNPKSFPYDTHGWRYEAFLFTDYECSPSRFREMKMSENYEFDSKKNKIGNRFDFHYCRDGIFICRQVNIYNSISYVSCRYK